MCKSRISSWSRFTASVGKGRSKSILCIFSDMRDRSFSCIGRFFGMRGISGIQGIYRYRHGIMVSDMPDCGWLLAPIVMWGCQGQEWASRNRAGWRWGRFMHDSALRDANSGYWILIERTLERVAGFGVLVLDGGVICRLLQERRSLTGPSNRYWRLLGRSRYFMGSVSRGLRSCSGSRGFVRNRREGEDRRIHYL